MSRSVYSTLHEWVSKLRDGDPFESRFPYTFGGMSTVKHKESTPKAAIITPCLHAQQQKRSKSRLEISKHIGHSPLRDNTLSVYDVYYEPTILNFCNDISPQCTVLNNGDSHMLGHPKRRTHGCYLCGQSGHGRYDCSLLKKYST